MEFIKIKYVGKRKQTKKNWTRKSYIFNESNDFTLDVPDKLASELLLTGNYLPVKEVRPETVSNNENVYVEKDNSIIEDKEEKRPVGRPKGSFKKGVK